MHVNMIKSLEQQNKELQARIKELEEPITCDGCKYYYKEYDTCAFEYDYQRPISKNCSRRFKDYYEPKEN